MQFPVLVVVAYYLTVDRAQGQSLERAGIYLPKSVFSHGHLYVALSRSGDPNKTFAFIDQREFENLRQYLDPRKTYTRNVVYREIFNT
jgi:ATP-dependent DNA helicase PIF1